MSHSLQSRIEAYADLVIQVGLNLQPGQSINLSAELAHADFVRPLVAKAYQLGARYVNVNWADDPTSAARLLNSGDDHIEYVPAFEVTKFQQMTDEKWTRLAIVGPEFPDALSAVPPDRARRAGVARRQATRMYADAMMAGHFQWCIAAVPTVQWAQKVFPERTPEEAVAALWDVILSTCRVDTPDPVAAWHEHDVRLHGIAATLMAKEVRSLHFLDPTPNRDGKPRTDLTVGLTDDPHWVSASSVSVDGIRFFANMPTEEIFTTPHRQRTQGYVQISKPAFPLEQLVENATIHFEDGVVVNYTAETGQETLDEFFGIAGANMLGEVALVDDRSPINQSGLLFHEILFDENSVCHIAFGEAYPEGIAGGNAMTRDELLARGANQSDMHNDMMIGAPTLQITGTCADGSTLQIMQNGRFVEGLTL